jgi:serine/threonine-protein kinase
MYALGDRVFMSSRDNLKVEEGLVGQVINDHFRIEMLLGRGNVGVVYRATDLRQSRQVALKIIKFDLAEEGLKARFDRDASVVANIKHPNAVGIYEYGLLSLGGAYFAMEFIDGITLRDLLRKSKILSVEQALNLLKQISSAVADAHKVGVTHRDLKPENIMLPHSNSGHLVKVTDFGLAKLKEGVGQSKANLTSAGEVMGTPCYMSPEQCLGTGVDERTDIYAMGIILFEMLAGKPPFEGNFFSVLRMHMSVPLPSIRQLVPDLPKPVEDLVNELLHKEKDKRPQSAEQVVKTIEQIERMLIGAPSLSAAATIKPSPSNNATTTAIPNIPTTQSTTDKSVDTKAVDTLFTPPAAKSSNMIYLVVAVAAVIILLLVVLVLR